MKGTEGDRGAEVQRRNWNILKTVSERRCPEGFSDAKAAE